jgi:hypothetical protein
MTDKKLNQHIISSKCALFLGAGASAPLGLQPTKQFLTLLTQRLGELVKQEEGKILKETSVSELFAKSARHHGVRFPDSEIVLDYLDYLLHVSQELHDFPGNFQQIAKTTDSPHAFRLWSEMFTRLRNYANTVIVEHYSRVDGKEAFQLYEPLLSSLSPESGIIPIFTTNYDWTFEHLTGEGSSNFQLVDGFQRSPLGLIWRRV